MYGSIAWAASPRITVLLLAQRDIGAPVRSGHLMVLSTNPIIFVKLDI